jgi:hypothetical protein
MSHYEKITPTGMTIRIMGSNRDEVNDLANLLLTVVGKDKAWRGPTLKNRYDDGWRVYLNFAPKEKEEGGNNEPEQG